MPASNPPLRLGLVGLNFGRHLLRTLTGLPGIRLVAVADRHADEDLLASLAAPPDVRLHADAVAMVTTQPLDGLIIATSPRHRAPLLAACATRNLPVFVEKPWAAHPQQAREFAAICKPIADRVMLGFSFRFHPVIGRLRSLLDGALGPAWMANGEYAFNWNLGSSGWIWDPEAGGGFFNENSGHLFDVVCHLLGRPVTVQAATHNPRNRPGPEFAAVTLTFASGAVAALTLGALSAAPFSDFPRLDMVTREGRAALRGRGHIWGELTWARRDAAALSTYSAPPEVLGSTRYSAALTHFVDCIRDRTTPAATMADGILAVDLAAALTESARSGARVALPPP